jgi:tetratricopeptide (TPR) repeat protein
MLRRLSPILLCLSFAAPLLAQPLPQVAPDETATRQQIDAIIDQAPHHRATLGTLQAAMLLSITFGAPTWNLGDHGSCCRFYVKTGQSLWTAFAADDAATGAARKVLDQLKGALDRVANSTDVEANAWTMRFVFDLTSIDAATEADRATRMVALGRQCTARSAFGDAQSAYGQAIESLLELEGGPIEQIPLQCRYAPLALSEALFGQRQYKDAAAAAEEGVRLIPQWPASSIDIRVHFADRVLYQLLFENLQAQAAANPKDADLQFLVGYHLYFTGQRDAAKDCFQAALNIDPNHAAAKTFLDAYKNPPAFAPAPTPPPQPEEPKGKVNGDL